MSTLKYVDIYGTANFESDAACMHLATLIDSALCLTRLDLEDREWLSHEHTQRRMYGKRQVLVSIEYAVPASDDASADAPKQGLIQIKDEDDGKVICEVPTGKTESQKVDICQGDPRADLNKAI